MKYRDQIDQHHLAEAAKILAGIGRDPDQRVTRAALSDIFKQLGIDLTKQTIAKIACTETDGPEYQLAFGRAYYILGPSVAWALGRFSKPRRSSFGGVAA
jgi:hypothetical protein